MKKKYQCEICKSEYLEESEALECESACARVRKYFMGQVVGSSLLSREIPDMKIISPIGIVLEVKLIKSKKYSSGGREQIDGVLTVETSVINFDRIDACIDSFVTLLDWRITLVIPGVRRFTRDRNRRFVAYRRDKKEDRCGWLLLFGENELSSFKESINDPDFMLKGALRRVPDHPKKHQ